MNDRHEITDAELAELQRLHEAATPPERFSVTRYGHGGGRVCAEPRDLVADFYSEADRECWIAARNALPALLSRLERADARVATLEDVAASLSAQRDEAVAQRDAIAATDFPLWERLLRVAGGDASFGRSRVVEAIEARIDALQAALTVGSPQHVALWDAINALVTASGGKCLKSVAREVAVAKVELALRGLEGK